MRRSVFVFALLIPFCIAQKAVASGFRQGQVDVTVGTPVLIGDKGNRTVLNIENMDGSNPIFCGTATVTSTTGFPILAGLTFSVSGPGQPAYPASVDIYCVATGDTVRVGYWEDVK